MRAQALRVWLNLNKIAAISLDGGWEGPLPEIARNSNTPEELRDGVKTLLSHLSSPGSHDVDTHLPQYGPLLLGMIQALNLQPDTIATLYALGSGRKHPVLSLIDAESAKAEAVNAFRVKNASALFTERMVVGADPAEVFASCWADSLDDPETQEG